jgi:hypothetical protein
MLGTYLSILAEDPRRLNSFFENPDREMRNARLSLKEQGALKSRDSRQIRAAMGGEYAPGVIVIVLGESDH